jgi:hypothetical protein
LINYIPVHGGITYASFGTETINHYKISGQDGYFIGFDCAHAGDMIPAWHSEFDLGIRNDLNTYNDFNFVKSEVGKLAKQLSRSFKCILLFNAQNWKMPSQNL